MQWRTKPIICPVALVGMFFLLTGLCQAENTTDSVSLTLSEATRIAIKQNPRLKAAAHQADAYASRIRQAESGNYPQLYFTETFNRTNNPMWAFGTLLNQESITQQDFDPDRLNDPDAINNFGSAVAMDWPVYAGGQIQIGIEQARKQHEAMTLMRLQTEQSVIADTAIAYVGLLLARKQVLVVTQALDTAKAHLKLVQSRFDSGFVVKSDLLRAQVRIAELEQMRLQTESGLKVVRAVLNASMGEPIGQRAEPTTDLEQCKALEGTLDEWSQRALSLRPDVKQLELQEAIARFEVDKTRKGHMPRVNLIGTYEINSEDFSDTADNYTIGAIMHLNIFSGYRISSGTETAMASLRQVQSMREHLDIGVRVETEKAFLEAQSAWDRIHMAKAAVSQAEEGLRIVKNRYTNGLLTIVSLMDAEVALQQARTRHFQAMHDYKVSRIRLALATGTIDADAL